MKKTTMLFFAVLLANTSFSQNESNTEQMDSSNNNSTTPCISVAHYAEMIKQAEDNIVKFGIKNQALKKSTVIEKLDWPLKNAAGFDDCEFYIITNFVDQDKTAGIKDYNCGSRTYNGHQGTDISLWPYPQYKQENKQVEVIAAKTGVIVNKADGFFDQKCVGSDGSGGGNYVMLQHTDGTRTIYYHMKKNSVTTKNIGETIEKGEYLGTVGSSGSSSVTHLHFEVWNDNKGTYGDPFEGTCNALNATTLWNSQKPYLEPAISKISIHTAKPVTPACPGLETLNESYSFAEGTFEALFYIHKRDEEIGVLVNLKIKNPDGSTFSSWTSNGTTTWNGIVRSWLKSLPLKPGIYTYEAELHGKICAKTFEITGTLGNTNFDAKSDLRLYPNPSNGTFTVQIADDYTQASLLIFNNIGQQVFTKSLNQPHTEINIDLASGIYFYKIINNTSTSETAKLIIK